MTMWSIEYRQWRYQWDEAQAEMGRWALMSTQLAEMLTSVRHRAPDDSLLRLHLLSARSDVLVHYNAAAGRMDELRVCEPPMFEDAQL